MQDEPTTPEDRKAWEKPRIMPLDLEGRTEGGTTPLTAETGGMTGIGYNSLLS